MLAIEEETHRFISSATTSSKVSSQITSKTWYNSCSPTLPCAPPVLPPRVLPLSLEFPFWPPAVSKIFTIGATVSFSRLQKVVLAYELLRSDTYDWMAMSWRWTSEDFVRPARKQYSRGRAALASGAGFAEVLRDAVRRVERTEELRRGVYSSVCDRRDSR